MSDESTAPAPFRFIARIVQEFEIEATTVGEAYAVMNRLTQRKDARAVFVDGGGHLAPASEAEAERLRSEVLPNV
jgi:phosphoketolase